MNGIEREFEGELIVIHINVQDPIGKELGKLYDFKYTPTFILLDPEGEEIWRTIGAINPSEVRKSLGKE